MTTGSCGARSSNARDPMQAADIPTIKGVVCGAGQMGFNHLRVLNSMEGVEVIAVADPDRERLGQVERTYPRIATHASLAEALESHEAGFACIAAPAEALPGLA